MESVKLNSEQRQTVDRMHEFAVSEKPFFLVLGQAGTGKTTCCNTFVRETKKKVALTAPTNKATRLLTEMAQREGVLVDCMTTYAAMGLRLTKDSEYLEVVARENAPLMDYDIAFLDEGSMGSEQLYYHARRFTDEGVKFIIMGDGYQLPPVNETESKFLLVPDCSVLQKVERHDNQILAAATEIRKAIDESRKPILKTDVGEDGTGVRTVNYPKMERT